MVRNDGDGDEGISRHTNKAAAGNCKLLLDIFTSLSRMAGRA